MQETFYTVPGCPVLVAQVSDLHERPYDGVIASLQQNRPDLICITGDFFFGRPVQTGLGPAYTYWTMPVPSAPSKARSWSSAGRVRGPQVPGCVWREKGLIFVHRTSMSRLKRCRR